MRKHWPSTDSAEGIQMELPFTAQTSEGCLENFLHEEPEFDKGAYARQMDRYFLLLMADRGAKQKCDDD